MDKPYITPSSRRNDSRGHSRRLFPNDALSALRLEDAYVLETFNAHAGTVRGLHFQLKSSQKKLVTVSEGAILDVSFRVSDQAKQRVEVYVAELNSENCDCLFIPEGYAHGYQTLLPNTKVVYVLDAEYSLTDSCGFNPLGGPWLDLWPLPVSEISLFDSQLPNFPQISTPKTFEWCSPSRFRGEFNEV
jgi:dTDP-4-dehydrorhamnose 3,5-epimerase